MDHYRSVYLLQDGMGHLKIVSGGLKLEGKTFVLDSLIASSIKSRSNQPIVIESTKNLTLRARHKNGYLNSWLVLGKNFAFFPWFSILTDILKALHFKK